MYNHLYDVFKHWFHNKEGFKNEIFFISDTHFEDSDMTILRRVNVSDEEQIKRINQKVGKDGTLIVLGDVGSTVWIKKIRASRKVLIMGNHDKGASNYQRTNVSTPLPDGVKEFGRAHNLNWIEGYDWKVDNKLFDEVYEGVLVISDKIILSHEPVDIPFMFNLHGHDHSNWYKGKQHLNLCAEHINYTPVSLNEIIKSGVLSKIPSIHRITINKAVERKGKKK